MTPPCHLVMRLIITDEAEDELETAERVFHCFYFFFPLYRRLR